MKKSVFQGLLALYGGFIGTVLVDGVLFRTLHWPGGCFILSVVVPLLVSLLFIFLAIYIFKHGALNAYVEKGLTVAKHLRNTEGTAFIFFALAICGFLFRHLHWPGGSLIVMLSCFTLMNLSLLAGILGCIFFVKKK